MKLGDLDRLFFIARIDLVTDGCSSSIGFFYVGAPIVPRFD